MAFIKGEFERFADYLIVTARQSPKRFRQQKSVWNRLSNFYARKELTAESFAQFCRDMLLAGYSEGTVNKYVALAKHYCNFTHNKCLDTFRYFEQRNTIIEPLTPCEIKKLAETRLRYARHFVEMNRIYRTLIYFLATTGCRIEEALGLTWSNVLREPTSVIFRDTKNKEQRQVPIADWLFKSMEKIRIENNPYVFNSYRGHRLWGTGINLDLKKRAQQAGIKKHVYCHIFRHSYITQMIKERVPIMYISRIVGHKDIQSTNHYTQLVMSDLQEAIKTHPLMREHLTYDDLITNVRNSLDKLIDTHICKFSLSQSKKGLAIKIERV